MGLDPGKAVYLVPVQGLTNFSKLEEYGSAGLRLPAAPMNNFRRNLSASFVSTDIVNLGEAISYRGSRLATISFSSILPDYSHFINGNAVLPSWAHQPTSAFPFTDPRALANILYYMTKAGCIFNLVITRPNSLGARVTSNQDVDVNINAVIENYSDWEEDGTDVWFDIQFKQWRPLTVKKVTRVDTTKKPSTTTKPKTTRPGAAPVPVTYKVKSGDTLSGIAAKLLGDSRRWRDIASLNGLKHPDLIKVGQVLKIPKK